jgi:hypothetical protein
VNLTKNISIKSSNGGQEEPDSDDFAKYFPNFVWVVRDFTLQLVDAEGDPISSKEYLEKSLAPQKGFSDGVEQKNRIRRLLTTFFKERDCFTLVRPLTNEENLQNLEKMNMDSLRPEFYEEMINLRRHVLNRLKPKSLNGKALNGEMFCGLLRSYIVAINNGAVPNIETAWSYVCKNECIKAVGESIEAYEGVTRDILHHKLPLPLEELKGYHQMAKEKANLLFKKKSIGEAGDEFLKELNKKIKQKYGTLRLENEKESNRACSAFIVREFQAIERKLKANEYKSFYDFEKELRLFHAYFVENGPQGPNKKQIILEFMQKSLTDAATFFLRHIQQEIELQKAISQDVQVKLEAEILEMKQDGSKEKNFMMQKLSQLETEKSELEVKEQNLRETMTQLKNHSSKFESEIRAELIHEKEVSQRTIEELKTKLNQSEEGLKEFERRCFVNDSEHQKEKALLSQKIQYFEKTVEDLSKKEKELSQEVKNTKKDHISQIKEASTKHDGASKALLVRVDELSEKVTELENELSAKDQKFELERRKWESNDSTFSVSLDDAQGTIKGLQRELTDSREQFDKRFEIVRVEHDKAITELNEKISFCETSLKHKDEIFKSTKSALEKEKAILAQKIEFLDLQITEARNQHSEVKKAYDATLKVLDGSGDLQSPKLDGKQFTDLKEAHRREIRQV